MSSADSRLMTWKQASAEKLPQWVAADIETIVSEMRKMIQFVALSYGTEMPETLDERAALIRSQASRIKATETKLVCTAAAFTLLHSEASRVGSAAYDMMHGEPEERLAALRAEDDIRDAVFAEEGRRRDAARRKPLAWFLENPRTRDGYVFQDECDATSAAEEWEDAGLCDAGQRVEVTPLYPAWCEAFVTDSEAG